MKEKPHKVWLLAMILVLSGASAIPLTRAQSKPEAGAPPALNSATREKVVRYIRQRFGVPDNVQLILGPLRKTHAADFYQSTVLVDDGKKKAEQTLLISRDSRFLIMGGFVDLKQNTSAEMVRALRETFKIPETVKLSVGTFHPSSSSDFQQGTLVADDGKTKQDPRTLLLSKDGRHLILGDIFDLGVDLQAHALRTISLRNEPYQGPVNAPVTVVEYADLQCPTCAKMHEFIENELLPRYPGKIRVVFKEFPLIGVHDWSLIAAIGCQCAYQLNPTSYVPLRSAIFRSQMAINITNVRDMVLNYGEQAGADRVKLAACMDSKASMPRIEADRKEGKAVNVDRTPTAFVNGKMLIGLPSNEDYYRAVDEVLHAGK